MKKLSPEDLKYSIRRTGFEEFEQSAIGSEVTSDEENRKYSDFGYYVDGWVSSLCRDSDKTAGEAPDAPDGSALSTGYDNSHSNNRLYKKEKSDDEEKGSSDGYDEEEKLSQVA